MVTVPVAFDRKPFTIRAFNDDVDPIRAYDMLRNDAIARIRETAYDRFFKWRFRFLKSSCLHSLCGSGVACVLDEQTAEILCLELGRSVE
jgi:hypothetical protein